MNSSDLRKRFFKFFGDRGHYHVTSSSLIPAGDPTLLFTNAGMNQFKDVFLGFEKRSYTRAVSIQKCVRAGGKHNDLDTVGFTQRHLTFFEMMGNFSFNDYFKREAIEYAWSFLTQELAIPESKLHVTVFTTDDDAYAIWKNVIHIPESRIWRLGEKENFWQMGDAGPCGPCSEIHIDRGPTFGCKEMCSPACDCDRFLEIWNLVFMEYNRQLNGALEPLAHRGVDTGMGLERLAAITQEKDSVFAIDLFSPLINAVEKITGVPYEQGPGEMNAAFHVLADHARSATLLASDGCAPSNEGRGYVLRKIIRRAALFAQKLSHKPIFSELVSVVAHTLSDIYPEIMVNQNTVAAMIYGEGEKFAENLQRGQEILKHYYITNSDTRLISGKEAFKLYDTYGFPRELIVLAAREQGYTVDVMEFEQEMEKQRETSGKKQNDPLDYVTLDDAIKTEFTGYHELETSSSVIALIEDEKSVPAVLVGHACWVMTRKSPFFIVGGGQVPDQGTMVIDDHTVIVQEVRYIAGRIAALIDAPCDMVIGTSVTSRVDSLRRTDAMKNHTATHLLQSALIATLGHSVKQAGSLVHPDYLRFDFTYHDTLSRDDLAGIEEWVNAKIRKNIPVTTEYTTLKDALHKGALAFFGDKYDPEQVRVVQVDNFSVELCGGTHVGATGDIGVFKIIESNALSAGHRRIVAVTGRAALSLFQSCFETVKMVSQEFKVKKENVLESVLAKAEECKKLTREIERMSRDLWKNNVLTWLDKIQIINDVPFLYYIYNADSKLLRDIALYMVEKKEGLFCLVHVQGDTLICVCALSSSLEKRLSLNALGMHLKKTYDVKGGGNERIWHITGSAGLHQELEKSLIEWLSCLQKNS